MKRNVVLSIGIALGLHATGFAQDSAFYEAQLQAGREAMAGRRVPEAIDHLRIAAFGLLDRPALLSEALARLALAQQASGDAERLAATIDRLVAVEQKFSALRSARLEPETRTALSRLLEARVPRQTFTVIQSSAPGAPRQPAASPAAGSLRPVRSAPLEPTPDAQSLQTDDSDGGGFAHSPTPAAGLTAAGPAEAEAEDASPRYRATVKPLYPASALRRRIGGIVLLRVLVSESGKPMEIDVVREVHPDLSAAAVRAVRRWDFEPARRNGVPVAAWTTVPIPFRP